MAISFQVKSTGDGSTSVVPRRAHGQRVYLFLRSTVVGLLLQFSIASWAVAAPIVEDTTIDAGSSFNSQGISIADGVDGPTTVELVEGGSVKGFEVTENSKLIIDGGTSTYLSGVSDNAQLIFRSGTLGCSDFELCGVIDPVAVLFASGTSQLHFFAGEIDGPLQLRDMSAAHFYGRELEITESGGGQRVTGQYLNGDDISLFVNRFLNSGPQIFLHEIPEPGTFSISSLWMLLSILFFRTRGLNRIR